MKSTHTKAQVTRKAHAQPAKASVLGAQTRRQARPATHTFAEAVPVAQAQKEFAEALKQLVVDKSGSPLTMSFPEGTPITERVQRLFELRDVDPLLFQPRRCIMPDNKERIVCFPCSLTVVPGTLQVQLRVYGRTSKTRGRHPLTDHHLGILSRLLHANFGDLVNRYQCVACDRRFPGERTDRMLSHMDNTHPELVNQLSLGKKPSCMVWLEAVEALRDTPIVKRPALLPKSVACIPDMSNDKFAAMFDEDYEECPPSPASDNTSLFGSRAPTPALESPSSQSRPESPETSLTTPVDELPTTNDPAFPHCAANLYEEIFGEDVNDNDFNSSSPKIGPLAGTSGESAFSGSTSSPTDFTFSLPPGSAMNTGFKNLAAIPVPSRPNLNNTSDQALLSQIPLPFFNDLDYSQYASVPQPSGSNVTVENMQARQRYQWPVDLSPVDVEFLNMFYPNPNRSARLPTIQNQLPPAPMSTNPTLGMSRFAQPRMQYGQNLNGAGNHFQNAHSHFY